MAYATVAHVQARNAARATYSASTTPSTGQVVQHIYESAAQLDQWLLAGGYAAPFDQAIASGLIATGPQLLLQRWNSIGAALAVEESSVDSNKITMFQAMWAEVQKIIVDKTIDVPLPMSGNKAMPRGFGRPGFAGGGIVATPVMTFGNGSRSEPWDL